MQYRGIILDVETAEDNDVTIKAVPVTTSVGDDLVLQDEYSAITKKSSPVTLSLPVKPSGTITYTFHLPKGPWWEKRVVHLAAGDDISLSALLVLGTESTDTVEDFLNTRMVRFDDPQSLTDEQKLQARTNIGAGTGEGGGGTSDHGALSGLADDDHPQYLNTARGDARYYTEAEMDTALAGKVPTSRTINGKALSSNITIEPSDLTEDSTHRFVTDTEKTTWNAKQDALGFTPENSANKNQNNGYAGLDSSGLIPSALLPSFVDDVIDAANFAALPGTGATGKIYVTLDNNKTYRWSGSAYVEISASPGSTDSVTEGSVNLYFTAARVLAVVLTGLSTVTGTAISAADTILSALGKLQAQITNLASAITTKADNGDVVHNSGDETIAGVKTFTSSPIVPTPTNATDAANKEYVDNNAGGVPLAPGAGAENTLPRFNASGELADSGVSDNGTTITMARRVVAPGSDFDTNNATYMIKPTGAAQSGMDYHASGIWGWFINNIRRLSLTGDGTSIGKDSQYAFNSQAANNGTTQAGLGTTDQAVVKITDGSTGGGGLQFKEMTAPSAPALNNAIIYLEDNGSGKTKLMIKYSDGSTDQLSIQP